MLRVRRNSDRGVYPAAPESGESPTRPSDSGSGRESLSLLPPPDGRVRAAPVDALSSLLPSSGMDFAALQHTEQASATGLNQASVKETRSVPEAGPVLRPLAACQSTCSRPAPLSISEEVRRIPLDALEKALCARQGDAADVLRGIPPIMLLRRSEACGH